jgi:hypothetical protein
MDVTTKIILVAGVLALLASACGAEPADTLPPNDNDSGTSTEAADDPTSGGADSDTPIDPGDGIGDGSEGEDLPVVSPDLSREIDLALADLTERLGGDVVVGVTLAFELTWPDGSLGCPQPDMAYNQVLIDGYLIELTDGTDTYSYHGALGEDPFLCETRIVDITEPSPKEPSEQAPPSVPGDEVPSESASGLAGLAVADLADRLGVAAEAIVVVSVESVVWPDASIGCPQPGMRYQQVQVDGARIVLEAEGATWVYHSGGSRPPFLCDQR